MTESFIARSVMKSRPSFGINKLMSVHSLVSSACGE